jgi:dienelactone hydrolase
MTELVLFHHAQGLTPGVRSFADRLRAAGHTVHTPDLFEGRTFDSIDEGVAYAKEIGFGTIAERGRAAAESLSESLVYAGMSMGVMCAQMLAQTRPGATGALLFFGCFPPDEFETPWPQGVPAQIHMMGSDPWVLEGDLDAARALSGAVEGVELFLYEGDRHVFIDQSTSDYDEASAALATERTLAFLETLG